MCAHRCALTWGIQRPCLFLQASRPLHYLVYFLKGVGIGAYGIERELLASEGKLARRWMLWCITAAGGVRRGRRNCHRELFSYEFSAGMGNDWRGQFRAFCAASSFAFLALCAV